LFAAFCAALIPLCARCCECPAYETTFQRSYDTSYKHGPGSTRPIDRRPYLPLSIETPQEIRRRQRGQLAQQRTPLVDFYEDEVTDATRLIATGDFSMAAKQSQLALTDAWAQGMFGTFVASITRLPRKFFWGR
jgi:hypothetical protein